MCVQLLCDAANLSFCTTFAMTIINDDVDDDESTGLCVSV